VAALHAHADHVLAGRQVQPAAREHRSLAVDEPQHAAAVGAGRYPAFDRRDRTAPLDVEAIRARQFVEAAVAGGRACRAGAAEQAVAGDERERRAVVGERRDAADRAIRPFISSLVTPANTSLPATAMYSSPANTSSSAR